MTHRFLGVYRLECLLWLSLCICPCIALFLVGSVEEFLYPYNVTGLLLCFLIGLEFVCHHSFHQSSKPFNESLCSVNSFQQLSAMNMGLLEIRDVLINVGPFHLYSGNVLPSSFWHKLLEEGLYKGASDSWILPIL